MTDGRTDGQTLARSLLPLGDRVLIQRAAKETKTAGGIILPTSSNNTKTNEGEVVAVGPGQVDVSGNLHKIDLQVGDRVLLPEYGGISVKLDSEKDEEELALFRADDILGKITN